MGSAWSVLQKLKLVESVDESGATTTSEESLEDLISDDPFQSGELSLPPRDELPNPLVPQTDETSPAPSSIRDAKGKIDFIKLFDAAGVPSSDASVERAISLRETLGSAGDLNAQRKTVLAALKSFGIDVKALIKDAALKHSVLVEFLKADDAERVESVESNKRLIEAREAEIQALRQAIERSNRRFEATKTDCETMIDRIEAAVDFLTEGDLVTESPKPAK